MLESTGSSKPRDALLEKLRERIKDRDRALEVKHTHINIFMYKHTRHRNEWIRAETVRGHQNALDT